MHGVTNIVTSVSLLHISSQVLYLCIVMKPLWTLFDCPIMKLPNLAPEFTLYYKYPLQRTASILKPQKPGYRWSRKRDHSLNLSMVVFSPLAHSTCFTDTFLCSMHWFHFEHHFIFHKCPHPRCSCQCCPWDLFQSLTMTLKRMEF